MVNTSASASNSNIDRIKISNYFSNKEFQKKYYNTTLIKRAINTLMNHLNMSLEEFEQVYALLNNRNDYISYLVLMTARIVKGNEPEDIITMIEDSINTAYFIHLKKLISDIDNKIAITNKKGLFRLMPLYEIFRQSLVQGSYLSYHSISHTYILPTDLKWMNSNGMNSIIFPPHFIYWTEEDLIHQAIEYYNIDAVYDDSLYSIIHSKLYSFVTIANYSDFIKQCMVYYYMTVSKERLNIYEEELIQKTWKPSRLFAFCLSEDEKMDFEC
jgi:hypothetical protein